jgi:hypothetical protein
METTFGRPQYVFPADRRRSWPGSSASAGRRCATGEIPVLFGYSLGKSQELLRSLASAELPIMLHPATFRLTRVYEELGLAYFRPTGNSPPTRRPGHVVVCPPQAADSSFPQARSAPGGRRS